jgi:hypothetical protein
MPTATLAAPSVSAVAASRTAPAFFVRACHRGAAARAALVAPVAELKTIRSRRRLGLLADATRRGGVRVVAVHEIERFGALDASLVGEIATGRQHYLAWRRLAQSARNAGSKIRALLSRPATETTPPERPAKMPVTTAAPATTAAA